MFFVIALARWQSGHAAACKAVDAGSIPTLASNLQSADLTGAPEISSTAQAIIIHPAGASGGRGRRYGLKIHFPKGSAGSSPASPTSMNRLNWQALEWV